MGELADRPEAVDYLQPRGAECHACGRRLARRVWVATVDGVRRRFCDERCERLFGAYWVPQGERHRRHWHPE